VENPTQGVGVVAIKPPANIFGWILLCLIREAALKEIAIEFLETHGIAYQREPQQK
jgi:hypothetical protein